MYYGREMDVLFDDDIKTFLEHAGPFLLADEAANNLMVALCRDIQNGRYSDRAPLLVRVNDESQLVTTALQTPPYDLLLSRCGDDEVWRALPRALVARGVSIPGVLGPSREAERFARAWAEQTGVTFTLRRGSRVFEVMRVRWPEPVSGEMIMALDAHRPLVQDWTEAFREEAVPNDMIPLDRMLAGADKRIDDGDCFLWIARDEPVSMACLVGRTPHGRRLSYVYTPPHRRRTGFAGALVANLTQRVLDDGCDFCFLFTDLSNPTSNRLYENIGYERVADCQQFVFE